MRKFLKIIFWLGGIGVVLITLVVLAIPRILPMEEIQRLAADQVRKKMNREFRMDGVRLGLLGFAIQSLKLSEVPTFSAGTFVEADKTRVRWSFLPFFRPKVIAHFKQGTAYTGHGTRRLITRASDIEIVGRRVGATGMQCELTIAQLQNTAYSGRDFSLKMNFRHVGSDLTLLDGEVRLNQGPGMIRNLPRAATSAPVILLPLAALQNLDQLGVVKLGLPDLSQIIIHKITGDYGFKNGVMTINSFKIEGPQLILNALGTIHLDSTRLNIDVTIHTPEPILAGEMDLKMRITGTLSNPKTNLDSLKKKAFKATVKGLLESPDAQKELNKALQSIFK